MMKLAQKNILRILDANANRLKEGLRVCEDTTRFVLNDQKATKELKAIRHHVGKSLETLGYKRLVAARDVTSDVGKADQNSEFTRKDLPALLYANAQRCKESIRVLEEYAKLLDTPSAKKLKRLRYSFYDIEQRIIKKI